MNNDYDIRAPCSCGYIFEYNLAEGYTDYKIGQPCPRCDKYIMINFGYYEDMREDAKDEQAPS